MSPATPPAPLIGEKRSTLFFPMEIGAHVDEFCESKHSSLELHQISRAGLRSRPELLRHLYKLQVISCMVGRSLLVPGTDLSVDTGPVGLGQEEKPGRMTCADRVWDEDASHFPPRS